MLTEERYFGPLQDVAFGIGQKFDYDKFKLWIERQQLNFSHSISIGGDLVSANWNGARPADLSAVDGTATAGFYLDTSVGSMQLEGDLFLEGDMTAKGLLTIGDADIMTISGTDGTITWEPDFNGFDPSTPAQLFQVADNPSGDDWFGTLLLQGWGWAGGGEEPSLAMDSDNTGASSFITFRFGAADLLQFSETGGSPAYAATFGTDVPILAWGGSASEPGVTFSNDPDTGIYGPGSNVLGFAVAGAVAATFDSSGNLIMGDGNHIDLANSGFVRTSFGDVSTPGLTFASDPDTGIYRVATNQWAASGGGVFQFATGNATNPGLLIHDGGALAGLRFVNDPDTGLYRSSANVMRFTAGGADQVEIRNGAGSSSLYVDRRLTDVGNVETARIDRDTTAALVPIGWFSSWEHDPVTGVKRKYRIVDLDKKNNWWKPEWFMDLKPIKFERIHNPKGHPTAFVKRPIELGFTIENLIEHTNLLTSKGDQVGDSPDELALIAVTVLEVQRLHRRIEELEAQLA